MIVVTGATGGLGSLIVSKLLERVAAEQIGVSVRNPAKAEELAARGVRVRRGDFAEPSTLQGAFAGASQLLLVSSNAAASGGDSLAQHRDAIAAAKQAGVRRIVYTSQIASSDTSLFEPGLVHAATEKMLSESGLAWTALRNGFYATRAVMESDTAMKSGAIATPEDGKVSWTSHTDLAEAAATILANEGRFDGPTPPLTGGEALDYTDLAAMLTELLGRPILRKVISDSEFENKMAARGLPPQLVKLAGSYYPAARALEFATVDPTLEQLIGRKPETLRSLVAAKLA
ncbi:SDR family oxidoreductase [Granulicella sibirica]|uniref:NADPH:quinone oxidoreductase n=1 Tax=Granulicella sibirica TaxID=2479048 RepID=A0A4Q0SW74_9BACT|nr:SDR family oxidoreductase [Granulicella sibirica]RXH55365.1 NADPH:quinone oxidoreductase [Granulicella sibirica]